jgi:hypothetical protein
MKESNWDNPSFIPRIPEPIRIIPKRSRWRRKAPRKPLIDKPPRPITGFPLHGEIIFKKAA